MVVLTYFLAGFFLCAVCGWVFFWYKRGLKQESSPLSLLIDLGGQMASMRQDFQNQTLELTKQMNTQMQYNSRTLQESHEGFTRTVGEVHDRLGQLQQATQNMVAIGKDISSLQDILRAPKLRGGLGELLLSELLRQILPEDHYALQYGFQDGSTVDAVIRLGHGLIPVDAKFPLENFQKMLQTSDEGLQNAARKTFFQDVKKHIDQIASKYILPMEGTFEFALMYIPAENIYYETIIKDELQAESLSTYALKKKVIPVSPNSFYAYLQAIVRGLRGLRIERSAQAILESLGQLEADFKKCLQEFEKTGVHLLNAQSSHGRGMRQFERLQEKLAAMEEIGKTKSPAPIPSDERPKALL